MAQERRSAGAQELADWELDQNDLFALALGLSAPWEVERSGFEEAAAGSKFLYVDLEVAAGVRMPCPVSGELSPLYDHGMKCWWHLNFWLHATYLSARVSRIQCPRHQVNQVTAPWERPEKPIRPEDPVKRMLFMRRSVGETREVITYADGD